ncbi:hypothetical protein GVX76_09230 [[Haemophilus] felis]|nr:hypothetical protein [[Haemophilus] felis]
MQGGSSVLKGVQTLNKLSNSTKFTLGIAGAGSVGTQLIINGTVDPKTLAVDLATAYALKRKGLAINAAGEYFNRYF